MEFTRLSRKHSFKVSPVFPCSVEECSLALGEIVGHGSIKSAARMNGAVLVFVDSVEKANTVVESGIVINDTFVSVTPLTTPATKVTVSNIPPFIRDEVLQRELCRYGKIVSPFRKLPSGCKSLLLRHVVSHRRRVLMILNKKDEELNLVFRLKVDDFYYVVFVNSGTVKCFGCGEEGHLVRVCPEKNQKRAEPEREKDQPGQTEKENKNQQMVLSEDDEIQPQEAGEKSEDRPHSHTDGKNLNKSDISAEAELTVVPVVTAVDTVRNN
ncbi:hypothetical protein F2P81_007531 [Scophthalmus maximus]|uniref:CCHC-type domain-containing protein n=1 Tax=Scophthalmus maximus TaxID=52904 RepID=A0A6A4SVM7_SCOMX|nr:hypothetical protein F2P81_007531 [Scophthalmus maximus]